MASALRDLKDHSVKQQGEIERLRAENARLEAKDLRHDHELCKDVIGERDGELERLREALTDIEKHSVEPFTSAKWGNYVNEVARAALNGTPNE
jgi:hypothetical protein